MSPVPDRAALQPERTALAWQRTAVTGLVSLVPLVLVALRTDRPFQAGGGAVAMAVSTGLLVAVRRRLAQLGDDTRGYSPFAPMAVVAVVAVVAGIGGAVLGVSSWLG